MVQSGFRLRAQFDSDEHYVPPGDWNGKFQDEWVFEYIRCVSRQAADHVACRMCKWKAYRASCANQADRLSLNHDLSWAPHFCREGCANPFVLHLSLQSASGRMFVQASEMSDCDACQ